MGQALSLCSSSSRRPRQSFLDWAINFGAKFFMPSPPIGHESFTFAENVARLLDFRPKSLAGMHKFYFKGVEGSWDVAEEYLPRPEGVSEKEGPVRALVHTPPGGEHFNLPLVVYAHGGGLCTGDCKDGIAARLFNQIAAQLPDQKRFCWVSVDYRLAPEAKFPKAVDDMAHAFLALQDPALAARYGYDPRRIGVAGLSAGGFLAGHAALRLGLLAARGGDRGPAPPAFAAMLNPMVDPTMQGETHAVWGDVPMCYGSFIRFSWQALLSDSGEEPREERRRQASLLGTDWSPCRGLRMLNVVATCDVLADEGLALTRAMAAGGVSVEEIVGEGSHSLGLFLDADAKKKHLSWWCRTLTEP